MDWIGCCASKVTSSTGKVGPGIEDKQKVRIVVGISLVCNEEEIGEAEKLNKEAKEKKIYLEVIVLVRE